MSEVIRCLALGGALTIGTLDGANIEIRDEVCEENIFILGLRADEVSSLIQTGYHAGQYLGASQNVRRVVDTIAAGHFSRGDKDLFRPIVSKLLAPATSTFTLPTSRRISKRSNTSTKRGSIAANGIASRC